MPESRLLPVLVSVAVLVAVSGCGSAGSSYRGDAGAAPMSMETAEYSGDAKGSVVQGPRSVVRTASMQVKVGDLRKADSDARAEVSKMGGFIDSSQRAGLDTGSPQVTLVARVPVAKFDQAMKAFEGLGTLLSSQERSEDVTVTLADQEARLKTMLAQEEAYRSMLRESRTVKDSIALQDRLMELRGEIESLAAQRRALVGQATMSTIDLTLTAPNQPPAAITDKQAADDAWTSANASFDAFRRSLMTQAIFVAVYWPVWLAVLLPFAAFLFYGVRAGRRAKATAHSNQTT
ncbi:MAG: DUF4349 domain-containing protein [Fimbriimonadaceae bacterium]|nr:DUF4349 domain-containing protein [Fimbriimonadaceae bacterium]QYK57575.1 MAG: DUF4349 domain-containing protein [Fimbriimonadaceae bacterium]